MSAVFLDTAGLIAIASIRDGLHTTALRVRRRLSEEQCPFVTSQWVLTEFLGAMSHAAARGVALRTVDAILASPRTSVVAANPDSWNAALEYFRSRPDKDWSLVDCSSMIICGERKITRVMTADRHFVQAGFEVLL